MTQGRAATVFALLANSGGFPPQWIEVDLGEVKTVGEIDLGITQFPDSPTVHELLGRSNIAHPWTLLTEFAGFTVDQQILHYSARTSLDSCATSGSRRRAARPGSPGARSRSTQPEAET